MGRMSCCGPSDVPLQGHCSATEPFATHHLKQMASLDSKRLDQGMLCTLTARLSNSLARSAAPSSASICAQSSSNGADLCT